MDTKSENLNPLDSLKIISEMIEQAKGNVQKGSFYFLFWGWVIIIINLSIYGVIKFTNLANPYMMWLLTLPAWIITIIYGYRNKSKTSKSHLDYVRMCLWISFSITLMLLCTFCAFINYQINGVILLVTAIPTITSGALIKFKPLLVGGALFWIFGSLCFMVTYETQLLLGAIGIFAGYLIPGYWLKNVR